MNLRTITLTALAAVCLVLGGNTVVAEDAKDAQYTIVVHRVQVKTTKADGATWDINNGKPDLAVIVRNVDEKDVTGGRTKTKEEVFEATFDETLTTKVRAGQTLEIEVVDVDVAVNDTIGKIRKEITPEVLAKKKLKFENFEQVISLEIELKGK